MEAVLAVEAVGESIKALDDEKRRVAGDDSLIQ